MPISGNGRLGEVTNRRLVALQSATNRIGASSLAGVGTVVCRLPLGALHAVTRVERWHL